jgi:hypothetical protein
MNVRERPLDGRKDRQDREARGGYDRGDGAIEPSSDRVPWDPSRSRAGHSRQGSRDVDFANRGTLGEVVHGGDILLDRVLAVPERLLLALTLRPAARQAGY